MSKVKTPACSCTDTCARLQAHALMISPEMFEQITARAFELAAEQFRRMAFDTAMRPEAIAAVRDEVIDRLADRHIERWVIKAKFALCLKPDAVAR